MEHHIQGINIHDDLSDVLNKESFAITQQIPVNEAALSGLHTENIHHTTDDYERISDDDIMDVINSAINISIVPPSTDTQSDIPTKRLIIVDGTKKRSQEATRRRCKNRNAVRRTHRHDFDIIGNVYRLFKIQPGP